MGQILLYLPLIYNFGDIMKKIKKLFLILTVTLLISVLGIQSAFAETYFDNGVYKFLRVGTGQIMICDYHEADKDLVVPETIFGDTVVSVDFMAFANCENSSVIESITLPETITSLNRFVFMNMANLKSINIPANCSSVGTGLFQGCTSLTDVKFDAKVTEIPDQMFYQCSSLKSFEIPDTATKIGNFAFAECTSLQSVYIPKTVDTIGNNAFKNTTNVVIYGHKGTIAERFAAFNNLEFVDVDNTFKLGDVDIDGIVSVSDATLIQRYCVLMADFDETQISLADFNGDGLINVSDATKIQIYLVSK